MTKQVYDFLRQKRVATIDELCTATGRVEVTVRKMLAKLDYLTSYDKNSRLYTLRSVCRFNRHGIWRHERASFTCHGTLKALLVTLVDNSPAGYTCAELATITGVSVTEALRSLIKKQKVVRIRHQRQYVYFTARSKRSRAAQVRKRFGTTKPLGHLEADVPGEELKKTIIILLEIIRSRPQTIRSLRDRLRKVHPEIANGMVNDVCRQYGIQLKKKIDPYRLFDTVVKLGATFHARTGEVFIFHFRPEQRCCPSCGRAVDYYKTTRARTIQSLRYGRVAFRETQVRCPEHLHDPDDGLPLIYGSSFLRSLAPTRSAIGYDVIVEIGRQRFLEFRQVGEVIDHLQDRGIGLSSSSVSRWADFFLAAVECLHYTKIRKLRYLIKQNGGYLLHIDATTETKSDTVFVCVDRILGTVLLSEKIASENEEEVEQALHRLKHHLGTGRDGSRIKLRCGIAFALIRFSNIGYDAQIN